MIVVGQSWLDNQGQGILFVPGFFPANFLESSLARSGVAAVLSMVKDSGACGSGGSHDGTGGRGRPKFLCYNFQKMRARSRK
jgi:hypothetical protein